MTTGSGAPRIIRTEEIRRLIVIRSAFQDGREIEQEVHLGIAAVLGVEIHQADFSKPRSRIADRL